MSSELTKEKYDVEIERDQSTQVPVTWAQKLNGELHRTDGPAIVCRDRWTGQIESEHWYQHGKAHRINGPQETVYFSGSERVQIEVWRQDGGLHRDGLPAYIEFDRQGFTVEESWHLNDRIHRPNGPAIISWDPETRVIVGEEWWMEGQPHRQNEPAVLHRDPVSGLVSFYQIVVAGRIVQQSGSPNLDRFPNLKLDNE